MAAAAILDFWNFKIFNGRNDQEGRSASSCQISSNRGRHMAILKMDSWMKSIRIDPESRLSNRTRTYRHSWSFYDSRRRYDDHVKSADVVWRVAIVVVANFTPHLRRPSHKQSTFTHSSSQSRLQIPTLNKEHSTLAGLIQCYSQILLIRGNRSNCCRDISIILQATSTRHYVKRRQLQIWHLHISYLWL